MTSMTSAAAAVTSFEFYTVEMNCLSERLENLQDEVREARYSAFSEFQKKLITISTYFLEKVDTLIEQFSVMKNADTATSKSRKIFLRAVNRYNRIHEVTKTLIHTKCANLLAEHALAASIRILDKTDDQLFSEGEMISNVFYAFQNEMNMLKKCVTKKTNIEAYEKLQVAEKRFNFAKRNTTARQQDFLKELQKKLNPPYSISATLSRHPVIQISISLQIDKTKHDRKLMIK